VRQRWHGRAQRGADLWGLVARAARARTLNDRPDTPADRILARRGALCGRHVPPLEIARLVALNTGLQGGYGTGDTIEITMRTRTDRAGFAIGQVLERSTVDELLVFPHSLGNDGRAYAGVWRDNCTLMIVAGNTNGAHEPAINAFSVYFRDDIHELKDPGQMLAYGSVASSPPLEGTFGAAPGLAGRLDPLRASLASLGARRHVPSPSIQLPHQRVGPLPWHETRVYDASRDRSSACDAEYSGSDGWPPNERPKAAATARSRPYALDKSSRGMLTAVINALGAPPPSPPLADPPDGLPESAVT
jgi:hypothetical protein